MKELNLPEPLKEKLDYTLFFRRKKRKSTHRKRTYSEYINSIKEKYQKSKESEKTWDFNTRPKSDDKSDMRAFDILKYLRHVYGLDKNRVDRGQLANYIRDHEYMVPAEIAPEMVDLEKVGDGQWLRKLIPYKTYEEIMKRAEMVVEIGRAIDIEKGGNGEEPFADEKLDWKFREGPRNLRNPFERYAFDLVERLRSICGLYTEEINKDYLTEKIKGDKRLTNPKNRKFLGEILAFEKGEIATRKESKLKWYLPEETYEVIMQGGEIALERLLPPNKTKEEYLQAVYNELKRVIKNSF